MAGISDESFINAYINPLTEGVQVASVQFFIETGKITGSFRTALLDMCHSVREDERNRIELEKLSRINLSKNQ